MKKFMITAIILMGMSTATLCDNYNTMSDKNINRLKEGMFLTCEDSKNGIKFTDEMSNETVEVVKFKTNKEMMSYFADNIIPNYKFVKDNIITDFGDGSVLFGLSKKQVVLISFDFENLEIKVEVFNKDYDSRSYDFRTMRFFKEDKYKYTL